MKRVKVNGPGVKLANKWCYIGDEAIIDDEEYNKMEKYVELIEEIEETGKESETSAPETPVTDPAPEGEQGEDEGDATKETEGENDGEDEELEALKDRAKELGINVTHNMKKETIIKKIEEAEKAEAGENQNPKGE